VGGGGVCPPRAGHEMRDTKIFGPGGLEKKKGGDHMPWKGGSRETQ